MKKLARTLGYGWCVIAFVPGALFVHLIGWASGAEDSTIVTLQLPFLFLQIFGLFMVIRYNEEIF